MRLQRACLWLLSCTALVVLVVSEVAHVSGAKDLDDNDMINRVLQEKVLSRKRRYLTFPEGSSLQVVFDQTIPIVGLPLLYTIGVTVAVAYELPSKPWYQYAKDIRQNIKTGAYLLRKDQNVSQLTYIDAGGKPDTSFLPIQRPALLSAPPAKTNLLAVAPNFNYKPVGLSKHSYYYKDSRPAAAAANGLNQAPRYGDKQWNRVSAPLPNPIYYANPAAAVQSSSSPPHGGNTKLQPVSNKLGYYFGKAPNQLANVGNQLSQWMKYWPAPVDPKKPIYWSDVVKGIKQMASRRKEVVPATGGVNQLPQDALPIRYGWKKSYRKPVLPVFGKRSVDSQLQREGAPKAVEEEEQEVDSEMERLERLIDHEEQKHFARHHRKTRHDLFAKIEVYLNSKGMDGRECVLRTLCETGQKHKAHHLPNTFAAELIKTIFRLPKKTEGEELTTELHAAYDLAHHESAPNCTDSYPKCKDDLWSHPLLF